MNDNQDVRECRGVGVKFEDILKIMDLDPSEGKIFKRNIELENKLGLKIDDIKITTKDSGDNIDFQVDFICNKENSDKTMKLFGKPKLKKTIGG